MTTQQQRNRVLAALTRAGDKGLTRVDFALPDVIDGGEPIINIPARILELRNEGFRIVSGERRNRCVVYRLDLTSEGQLFAVEPPGFDELCPPRNAIHDEAA